MSQWTDVCAIDELLPQSARLYKQDGHQLALFRLDGDELFAIDNRCPHEGYPLVDGKVKDCLVTCAWHNFKFDLRDGSCVLGDEDVRSYPVRIREARVEVDLADPDPAEAIARLWASLEAALLERRMGQAARDVVRLLQLGVSEEEVLFAAARFDADFAEYGTTHVLPAAVDLMALTHRYHGTEAIMALQQAFDLAGETHQRRPRRPVPEALDPGDDPAAAGQRLLELVESEEAEAAEALLRGALRRGWGREIVEQWFLELAAQHFLDFGHALIYAVKARDLLDIAGWDRAEEILPALLFRIVVGTREDTLPTWSSFRARLDEVEPQFGDWCTRQLTRPSKGWNRDALVALVLDGRSSDMFAGIAGSLELGVPFETICDALVIAASERIGRFDLAHDQNPEVQDGWLFVTHLLTYANAVRHAMRRHEAPSALRHLFFAGQFIHKAQKLDLPEDQRGLLAKIRIRETLTDSLEQLRNLILERKTEEAVTVALKYLARKRPRDKLRDVFLDLALEDRFVTRPIFAIHLIKTTVAAFEELDELEDDAMYQHPILALTKLYASERVERFATRAAKEAYNFVVHGKTPRVLSS